MMDELDKRVLSGLVAIDVPGHAPGFEDERRRRLQEAARRQASLARRRGRLRLLGVAAAVAAAAAVVIITWIGLPGTKVAGPETATAAQVISKLDQAIASARTLSGRLVVITPDQNGHVTYGYRFATTAAGDLSVQRLDGEESLTCDLRTGTALHVIDLGAGMGVVAEKDVGLAAGPPDAGPPDWILQRQVGAVVRALAVAKDPSVRATEANGRAVWILSARVQPNRLALPEFTGDHLTVTVDRATGLPLRIVERRGSALVQELRMQELRVNEELSRSRFHAVVSAKAKLSRVDNGFRRVGLGGAAAVVGYRPPAPLVVPQGFTLAEVTVARRARATGKEGMNPQSRMVVSMAFRRGFDRLIVSSRRIGPDTSLWTDPLASAEGYIDKVERVKLSGGMFDGLTAHVVIDLRGMPHVWVIGHGLVVTVGGELSRRELLAAAQSLRPYSE